MAMSLSIALRILTAAIFSPLLSLSLFLSFSLSLFRNKRGRIYFKSSYLISSSDFFLSSFFFLLLLPFLPQKQKEASHLHSEIYSLSLSFFFFHLSVLRFLDFFPPHERRVVNAG